MTVTSEEVERMREAFMQFGAQDIPSQDCPPAGEIMDAVRDELDPSALRRVLGHVASCGACTEAWRLAEEVEKSEPADARASRSVSLGWQKAASVLAAAALVVVIGLVIGQPLQGPEPVTRSAGVAGVKLEIGSEPLPRDKCLLRWTAYEDARYEVIVSTEDLDAVSKAVDLDRPEYLVPAELLPADRSIERLLAYIEVQRPGEGTIASGTFPFSVR
ncbi:MAG: hypothetical protein ACE5GX_00135 [Thermoanaerobaculia bacterium]